MRIDHSRLELEYSIYSIKYFCAIFTGFT